MRPLAVLAVGLVALAASPCARSQVVSGQVFVDLDANGIRGATESAVAGIPARLFGPTGEVSGVTALDGAFALTTTTGCRALDLGLPVEPDPATGLTSGALRRVEADSITCPAAGSDPVGRLRMGLARNLRARMQDPSYLYIQLGDSIAAGVSVCIFLDTDYSPEVAAELDCLGPGTVTRSNRAVGGWHSEDLLTPMDGASVNNQYIPRVVAADPDLVTLSIGGNDFLNTEPNAAGQRYPFVAADLQRSLQELIHTRRTTQEILSVLTTQLPGADIEINSVYDNLAPACATTDFHAAAPPMWNQMLRHLAWGQVRPALVGEVEPEFAHQDVLRGSCCGATGRICAFDNIHPTDLGADIIQHAVMESLGRVNVAASGVSGLDIGVLPLVAVLSPTTARVVAGASAITTPGAAVLLDGAPASVGPGGVLELSGFTLPAGITPARVIVGVRYKTSAAFADDTHRFDASFVDFAPPQWTFTGWDTVTPIVGGSGTAGNIGTPSVVNALPGVPAYRSVTAMMTLNATDDGRITGRHAWPTPTAADIAAAKVRLAVTAVGTPDAAQVEWDGAWLWVYGQSSSSGTPPDEVSGPGSAGPLLVRKAAGIAVSWSEEPLAETYRVWRGFIGDWDGARCEPGVAGGCIAAPALEWIETMPPDDSSSWFFLVSAVNADGAGPVGADSFGVPETTLPAACP